MYFPPIWQLNFPEYNEKQKKDESEKLQKC
jgi:hypothetical protein